MGILLGTILVAMGGVVAAAVVRRLTGWNFAVAGGVAAGLLLGPAVLGRMAPEWFERWMVGAIEARAELSRVDREHEAYLFAAGRVGLEPAGVEAEREAFEQKRRTAEAAWRAARYGDEAAGRAVVLALAAIVLLGGRAASKAGPAPTRMVDALSIGLWSGGVPAMAAMCVLWVRGGGISTPEGLLVIAAAAVGAWRPARGDVEAAEAVEPSSTRLMERSAAIARVAASGLLAWTCWRSPVGGVDQWLLGACVVAPWLGLVAAARDRFGLVSGVAIPALAALASSRIEWLTELSLWPLVLLGLFAGDYRWVGAWIGAVLPGGRRASAAMAMVVGSMAAGPTQMAVAAIGLVLGVMTPALGGALLCGAVMMELSEPARRHLLRGVLDDRGINATSARRRE
jgi:hypothetical protein